MKAKAGIITWAHERKDDLRFLALFAALAGSLSVAYCFPYPDGSSAQGIMHAYLLGYARLAGALVRLLDPSAHVTGHLLAGRFTIAIVGDCDAMEAHILFAAAVLAHRTTWQRKVVGLLAGTAFIALANVVRLWTIYFAGVYWPGGFDFLHRELWPTLLVVVGTVAFLQWGAWTQHAHRPEASEHASA